MAENKKPSTFRFNVIVDEETFENAIGWAVAEAGFARVDDQEGKTHFFGHGRWSRLTVEIASVPPVGE
jgi:hypothetical protein